MRLLSSFCALLALVALKAEAAQISGGVVAANNGHAFYRSFETGKTECITLHLDNPKVKSPFAVSEDGKTLVWMTDDGKFHTCGIPQGSEYALQTTTTIVKGELKFGKRDFELFSNYAFNAQPKKGGGYLAQEHGQLLKEKSISNLVISPSGTKCSFEAEMKALGGWTLVPPGHPLDRAWWAQNGKSGFAPEAKNLPMYAECEPGEFHGMMVSGIGSDRLVTKYFRCGNSYEYPGAPNYRPTKLLPAGKGGILSEQTSTPGILGWDISWPVEECCKKFSLRRDARFAAWSKDDKLMAVIYQTAPNAWGPIEIRSFDHYRRDQAKNVAEGKIKAGVYEISIQLPDCKGLAWMPSGALTFRTQDKLFKIDGYEITQAVEKSSVTRTKGPLYLDKLVTANNIFAVNPAEIKMAYKPNGTRLCWVSDSAFIIRGDDEALYLYDVQNQGHPEKLVPRVPEEFFYCRMSAPEVVKTEPDARTGFDKAPERRQGSNSSSLYASQIGTIKIGWEEAGKNSEGEPIVDVWGSCPPGSSKDKSKWAKLEVAQPLVSSLAELKDPSAYQYQWINTDKRVTNNRARARVSKGAIVIFKDGDTYAALQVVDFDSEWMSYQWKFWPKVVRKTDVAKSR